MKRICLYGASERLGGTEIYMMNLVRALKDSVKFDFLVHHTYGPIPFEEEILSYGGKVYREYYKNRESNLDDYISPRKLIEMHPEWDGIYLNLQRIDTSYRLLVEAKRKKIPHRILHSHNSNLLDSGSFKDKIYELYYKFTRKFILTDFLCCSKVAGYWMFGKKIDFTVIPNAINFELFRMDEEMRLKMRDTYQVSNDEMVIGYCGRLDEVKRPDFLIDIFCCLKKKINCKLLFVGDGTLKKELYDKVEKLKISEDVIFAGVVNNVKDYYQMMDCFVLPSQHEGFPFVIIEAQAAGLRCYATEDAVTNETNVTERVEFIPITLSAEAWADRILSSGFDRCDCTDILNESEYTVGAMKRKLLGIFENES